MPLVYQTPTGERIVFQRWDWLADDCYEARLFIVDRDDDGAVSARSFDGATYRARRRADLAAAVRAAGAAAVEWRLPPDCGYHQPLLVARWPGEPSR
jgi:hypothetical protein